MKSNHIAVTEINMWHNNLNKNQRKLLLCLNNTLISLSASLSVKTCHEMCEAYANQLNQIQLRQCHTYLSFIRFKSVKMFLKITILQNWANYEFGKGHFEVVAQLKKSDSFKQYMMYMEY
ncbi:gem-associated protein 5 [Vespula squamosa]|uniref:Gem-associated protein 5 n=1 Tax=Vespula squamosa TaxID=30214 RepID=A0ABD2BVZ9_VESSQ